MAFQNFDRTHATGAAQDVLLEASHLVKRYGAARAVDDVSLTLLRGEILGLVGESGSGKSTVGRMLLRLTEPSSGTLRLFLREQDGPHSSTAKHEAPPTAVEELDLLHLPARRMRALRRRMAIVFQDPYAALDPRVTVRQTLAEPFAIHNQRPAQGLEARLIEMLEEVGLERAALARYPHEFSGGQRQRINIARALALRPELLVLDEPVSALDVSVGAQVINLLRSLQARYGLTCLFITHSMPLARYLSQRIAVMERGRIVEQGTWSEVCDRPREAYTQRLLAATPELPVA